MDLSARFEFRHSTRQILFGWGVRAELGRLAQQHGARRCAIVADAIFRDAPVLHALRDVLGTAGSTTAAVFWVPPHEPDTAVVEACHQVLQSVDPDMVIAVGGGSTMDAAKVARIMLSNPGGDSIVTSWDKICRYDPEVLVIAPCGFNIARTKEERFADCC